MSRIMCARNVSLGELEALPEPARMTDSHYPVPFGLCHQYLRRSIESSGFKVVGEEIGLSENGLRAVGIIDLDDFGSDGAQTLFSWHNAHDLSQAFHVNAGDINKVCANMLTYGDSVRVSRKNTKYALRDLPRMVDQAVSQLVDYRQLHHHRIDCYRRTDLSRQQGADLILRALGKRIISSQDVAGVYQEWVTPRHWEFSMHRNAHRLLQAFTENWKGEDGTVSLPRLAGRCKELHGMLDATCHVLAS